MAYFIGNIRSKALCMDTQLHMILDDQKFVARQEGKKPKTLILLHGLSDNSAIWIRGTSIERYAERYNLTIVMPEGQRSFYTDMHYGLNYEKYIADELPEMCEKMFNTSIEPGDLLLAGLSMGGYGALRLSLLYPEKFQICGAFSPGVNMGFSKLIDAKSLNPISGDVIRDLNYVYKDINKLPFDSNMNNMIKKAAQEGRAPSIFMTCGTEDFLYQSVKEVAESAKTLLKDFHYEEWSGIHEWGFWDVSIDKFLHYYLD